MKAVIPLIMLGVAWFIFYGIDHRMKENIKMYVVLVVLAVAVFGLLFRLVTGASLLS